MYRSCLIEGTIYWLDRTTDQPEKKNRLSGMWILINVSLISPRHMVVQFVLRCVPGRGQTISEKLITKIGKRFIGVKRSK